jgi:transcription-repair coupling factor (superfamily II helicase)
MDQAVRELRGEKPREEIDPDVQLPLPALIPDVYMPDVHQRLYFYKRLAQAGTDEELEDARAEMVDRYGDLPEEIEGLLDTMALKIRLRALRIRALEAGPGRLVFTLGPDAALDPMRLAKEVLQSQGALRLTPDMKLVAQVARPAGRSATPKTPAGMTMDGRELLAAARRTVAELARWAADGAA